MEAPLTDTGSTSGPESGERTRIFILAEIRFYREGLARYFSGQPGVDVVGTAEDAVNTIELARGCGRSFPRHGHVAGLLTPPGCSPLSGGRPVQRTGAGPRSESFIAVVSTAPLLAHIARAPRAARR